MWWNVQQKSFLVVQSRYCKVGDTEQQSVTSKWENFFILSMSSFESLDRLARWQTSDTIT